MKCPKKKKKNKDIKINEVMYFLERPATNENIVPHFSCRKKYYRTSDM